MLWSVPAEAASTGPLILSSSLIYGGLDGAVQARDRESGALLWRRVLIPDYEPRGEKIFEAGGLVVIPVYDLWALDPEDGTVVWRFGGPDGAAGTQEPGIAGDTVFTTSTFGQAAALDARSGLPYWTVEVGEALFQPAVSSELVIYGTRIPGNGGNLIALRREDGSEAWRVGLPDAVGFGGSGGAVNGGIVWEDRVVVGSKAGWVYAVGLEDGEVLWSAPNGGRPDLAGYTTRPAIVDDVVIIGQANDRFDAWDVRTGELLWTWARPSSIADVVVVGDLVYTIYGPITVGTKGGDIIWEYGGRDGAVGGFSYFRGDVASDGTVYALRSGAFVGGGTSIDAVRPKLVR